MSDVGSIPVPTSVAGVEFAALPATAADGPPLAPAHLVQFYEQEDVLESAVGAYLADGLSAGEFVTVIATGPHWRAFQDRLGLRGIDVTAACATGHLQYLEAEATLATFMRNGMPDKDRFQAQVGGVIGERVTVADGARLRAYGEMVDVLWKRGERKAAVCLEELWNDLQTRHSFSLLCAYAMGNFYKEPAELHRVCGTHTHVIRNDGDGAWADAAASAHPTSPPPQYIDRLTREIAHREEIERALRESLRELREKEEQLRRGEERLKDFVENAPLGIHRVGPDGTILWANRAELELLGYTEGEYVGHAIREFHVDQDVIGDMLARLGRGEALHERGARLRAKDGSIKHVRISSNGYFADGDLVHTRCFTRDVTDRRLAEEALLRSAHQMQSVMDALPALVSYMDADRRYLFVSAAYQRWFERPSVEIIGRRLEEVIGVPAYETVAPYVERALTGQTVTFEAEVPYKDAGKRFVEATYIPQFGDDGGVTGYVALVNDISERKSFERFRAAAAARAERLLKITAAVASAVSAAEVLEAVVDQVAAAVDASTAGLWLLDEDGRTVRLARTVGYKESANQTFDGLFLDSEPSIPALDAIRRGEAVWLPSQEALVRAYPHLRGSVTPGRSYRISCLPLISQGRTLGALGLTIEEARETSEEERNFLLLVARYAGQAIERVRLLDAERRSRLAADAAVAHMGVLSRASRTFVDADLDLTTRLEDIVRALSAVLDSGAGIALVEADGRLHTCAVYHPVPEALEMLRPLVLGEPVAVGEGVTGRVTQTGESVLIPAGDPGEVLARAAPAYRPFLQRFPTYAMICAPLRARGKVIGAVTATRTREGESYTREDLRLLEELAERAAPAIENSRLHRENVVARSRAEQLYTFAKAVVSAEKVEDVFEAALDAISGALGTERAAILIHDDRKVMRFRAWRHLSDEYRHAVEGHSPWPADAVAPQPVLVPDIEVDAGLTQYRPLLNREAIRSLAFIPLVTRGQLIGKFMVYFAEPHTHSPHEIELATSIANHLASVTARFAAITKLEETIRYNDMFAGVLAHDLRNPLAAIMTAAQLVLMRQEGKGDANAKPLSRILVSGQRALRMIDQLLDVTRARVGGGIPVEPCETNLADLCHRAVGELEMAMPGLNVQQEVVGDQSGSWDADRLLQVVSNLVGNAAQHGRNDEPIRIRLDGRDADIVTCSIHNAGAIPATLLPVLFDPFRGARPRRDHSRGLGLGLFIVKEIVRGHGGTVDVASSAGEGTTFTIRMPRLAIRSAAFNST